MVAAAVGCTAPGPKAGPIGAIGASDAEPSADATPADGAAGQDSAQLPPSDGDALEVSVGDVSLEDSDIIDGPEDSAAEANGDFDGASKDTEVGSDAAADPTDLELPLDTPPPELPEPELPEGETQDDTGPADSQPGDSGTFDSGDGLNDLDQGQPNDSASEVFQDKDLGQAKSDAIADGAIAGDSASKADDVSVADSGSDADGVSAADSAAAADADPASDGNSMGDATTWAIAAPLSNACTAATCDDKKLCTKDACDPKTGACTHYLDPYGGSPSCHQNAKPCVESSAYCVCDKANFVCLPCLKDTDCGSYKACVAGECIAAPNCYSFSSSCPAGTKCKASSKICVQCLSTSDCKPGEGCSDGVCLQSCKTAADCDGGACLLPAGLCVECLTNAQCYPGEICSQAHACIKPRCGFAACAAINGKLAYFLCKADGSGYQAPTYCPGETECTSATCDPLFGCSTAANEKSCNDWNSCTFPDTCTQGVCAAEIACSDSNPCTADSCVNGNVGCQHVALADATTCTDKNVCTSEACSGGKCVATPLDGPGCADDSPCTAQWQCVAGACKGPVDAQANCDDGDECTVDKCDATGKCAHSVAWGAACNLANPCGKSTCGYYGCTVSLPAKATCSDGDDCTVDSCLAGKCQAALPNSMYFFAANSNYTAVAALPGGNWIRAGYYLSPYQPLLEQAGADGKALWGGSLAWSVKGYNDIQISDLVAVDDNSVVVLGSVAAPVTKSYYQGKNGYLLRVALSAQGFAVGWQHALAQGESGSLDKGTSSKGKLFAVGSYQAKGKKDYEPWLVATTLDGQLLWQLAPDTAELDLMLDVTAANGVVATVGQRSVGGKGAGCWLALFSEDGNWLKSRDYPGIGVGYCSGIVAVAGGFILVGATGLPGTGYPQPQTSAWLLRVDETGQLLNQQFWSGKGGDQRLRDVALLPNGTVAAIGKAALGNVLVIHADAAGNELQVSTRGGLKDSIAAIAGGPGGAWAVGIGVSYAYSQPEAFAWQFKINGDGNVVCKP